MVIPMELGRGEHDVVTRQPDDATGHHVGTHCRFSLRMLRILTKSATSRRRPTGTDRSRDRSIGRPAVAGMTPKELFARPISTGVLLARNISVRSLSAQVRDTEGLS